MVSLKLLSWTASPTIPSLLISLIPGGSETTATWSLAMVGPQHTNVPTAATAVGAVGTLSVWL